MQHTIRACEWVLAALSAHDLDETALLLRECTLRWSALANRKQQVLQELQLYEVRGMSAS